jgi:hypothetical protein
MREIEILNSSFTSNYIAGKNRFGFGNRKNANCRRISTQNQLEVLATKLRKAA